MTRRALERLVILLVGVLIGVAASSLRAAPVAETATDEVATNRSPDPALPQRPRVDVPPPTDPVKPTESVNPPETVPADASRRDSAEGELQETPERAALEPPPGAIESGAYSREDWDAALQGARSHTWTGGLTPIHVDERARTRALEESLPRPVKGARYQNRAVRHAGSFITSPQYMGGRARAAPLSAAERIAGPRATAEDREALRVALWDLERERRSIEISLVERENVLMTESPDAFERIADAEFWFTLKGALYVLQAGDDAEHARLLRSLEALEERVSSVKTDFHQRHR